MRLIKIILVSLIILAAIPAAAQECNLIFGGQVIDNSGEPVIGAAIILLPGQTGQAADVSGNFRFENLCPGIYTVKVHSLGYKEIEFALQINRHINRVIQLEEEVTELPEVTIRHHDAAQIEHATNFIQLNERELAKSAGKSLGESLKKISGVNSVQSGPGIFKPVIHGVHSQRILILNHGIRQEGQQWGAEHAPEIDPFIASNIAVIKDASAIKYGTDALGGVIVVNPGPLPETPILSGTFSSTLQSNGRSATLAGMLEGGIPKHEGWGWRAQGTYKRAGDFHTPDYSLTNTGIKETNFSAAAGYHEEKIGFDIFFSHFQTEIGILKGTAVNSAEDLQAAMEREVPLSTEDFSYSISEPRQEASHNLLKVNGHYQTDFGEWRLLYGFQNNNRREFDIRIGALSGIPSINLQLNTHSLDVEWETLHSERRTISIGLSSMLQDNKNIYGTRRIPFVPNFRNISNGGFGIVKLYRDGWTIDLGLRYDNRYYNVSGFDFKNSPYQTSVNFSNLSATAGASLQFRKNQIINLNLSTAWRPPHVAELYSVGTHQTAASNEYGLLLNDTTNEVMNIKEVEFRTEQALKFVATYQKEWQNVSLQASPYANAIFNYIYLRPVGITQSITGPRPAFRYAQTDALFLGADISAIWKIGKYVTITPAASLLWASDFKNHDYLIYIPSNKYEIETRFEKPSFSIFKNFYIESHAQYIARQTRALRVITVREFLEAQEQQVDIFESNSSNFDFMAAPEGYFLWNISVGASIKGNKVQYDFRVSSENTLNSKYREYTNRLRYFADDTGRNIIFSFKCIF